MSRNAAVAYLLTLSLAYCLLELIPGRFAVTDEVYFKAAGRNWAATGRFAAPEVKGFGDSFNPPVSEVFFAYPPLYPFLYGVYTKVVGFGPRSCILYDLAIHLLLVWCGALVARLLYGLPWGAAVIGASLLLPLGTVGRPDELGIVFALGAALVLRTGVPLRIGVPIGGALLGFCCATSLGACVFLGSIVSLEVTLREPSHLRKIQNIVITALIALVVAAVCVAPILVPHPSAYRQLAVIAADQTTFGNTSNGFHNPRTGFLKTWTDSLWYGYDKYLLTVACLIFCLLCWWFDEKPDLTHYLRFILGVFSLIFLFIALPGKYTYVWFLGPWLLIACVALGWRVSRSLHPSRWRPLLTVGVLLWLATSMRYFRWKAILWTLPTDQSLTFNINRVRAEVPVGVGVLTNQYWWALGDRNSVYDAEASNPGPDAFDYVVLTGNGSGRIGKPQPPVVALEESVWQIADNHLRSTPPSIFGLRLSRSAYGFGPYILRKIK